jgi:hypothetical protein
MPEGQETYKPIDFTDLLKGYEGKWVILSYGNDKIIKSGDSLEELRDSLDLGAVMLVPEGNYLFAP